MFEQAVRAATLIRYACRDGGLFYSYGVAPNRNTLETLFHYSHQQGLASREMKVEELFERASLSFSEPAA